LVVGGLTRILSLGDGMQDAKYLKYVWSSPIRDNSCYALYAATAAIVRILLSAGNKDYYM
jgi:hypothetical protein